jgi:hypothetical protein
LLYEGSRDQDALALAAGQVAKGALGEVGHPDRRKRVACIRALGAARSPVPGEARNGAHGRHVECGHREVEARPLGLGDDRDGGMEVDFAAKRNEFAEKRAEERRLATAIRAQDSDAVARLDVERDIPEHRRPAVSDGEVANGGEGRAHAHPRFPPVKPRIIAFAFASSIPR